jgi:hypothetical protein
MLNKNIKKNGLFGTFWMKYNNQIMENYFGLVNMPMFLIPCNTLVLDCAIIIMNGPNDKV